MERNWGISFLVVVGRALAKAQAARGDNEARRRQAQAQTTRPRGGGAGQGQGQAKHRLRLGVERVTGAGGWERTTDRARAPRASGCLACLGWFCLWSHFGEGLVQILKI